MVKQHWEERVRAGHDAAGAITPVELNNLDRPPPAATRSVAEQAKPPKDSLEAVEIIALPLP